MPSGNPPVYGRVTGGNLEFFCTVPGNGGLAAGTIPFMYNYQAGGQITFLTADLLTAHAGGGQASGLQLAAKFNRVTTVATGGDSVVLPPAIAGLEIKVQNSGGSASLNVFPSSATQGGVSGGDAINTLGANTAYALANAKMATFTCFTTGAWFTELTA